MPQVDRYYPYDNPNRVKFDLQVLKEYNYRKAGYNDALRYYSGKHNIEDVDDIIINLVKITCDRTVSFLFPRFPGFELNLDDFTMTPEEQYIVDTFEANGGLSFLYKLATLGFLAGHNFVMLTNPTMSAYKTYPKFKILDPLSVNIYWKKSEYNDVVWYEINNKDTIIDLVKRTEGIWSIIVWDKNSKRPISHSDYISPIPPLIEWEHYPNHLGGYGISEFGQKTLQNKINSIANILYKVTVANAEPKDVLLGADIQEVEQRDGNLLTVSTAGADIKRLEIKGDMAGIGNVLDRLIEVYLNVVRVVLLKGEPVDLQRVTNAAVRTLFLDSLAKREILISTYSKGLKNMARTILLMGYLDGQIDRNLGDSRLDINFHVPLPVDLSEIANQNTLALQGGYMSQSTAATRLGLDWRYENQAIDNNSDNTTE